MSDFLDLISNHDMQTLELDAKELLDQWPLHAAEVYQLMAQRSQDAIKQTQYNSLAEQCLLNAEQQKQQKLATYLNLSMS